MPKIANFGVYQKKGTKNGYSYISFFKLTNKEKAEYINLIAIHRNGREAIIINDNHYYDADDNEEITDLVEYAENLHDYGYKLFS